LCGKILTDANLCVKFFVTNQEIRRKILEMLYESFKDHPYGRITPKELQEMLKITLKELQFNAIYLEEKGLIELQKPLEGSLFVGARATPKGIDVVEDEYQLEVAFPAAGAKQTIPAEVFDHLTNLTNEVTGSSELNEEQKEIIAEEISEVQNELKKPEPSYSNLKKLMDRLKERDSGFYEKLKAIMKNQAVLHILSIAARKELGI
jgi:hypothetical protein